MILSDSGSGPVSVRGRCAFTYNAPTQATTCSLPPPPQRLGSGPSPPPGREDGGEVDVHQRAVHLEGGDGGVGRGVVRAPKPVCRRRRIIPPPEGEEYFGSQAEALGFDHLRVDATGFSSAHLGGEGVEGLVDQQPDAIPLVVGDAGGGPRREGFGVSVVGNRRQGGGG